MNSPEHAHSLMASAVNRSVQQALHDHHAYIESRAEQVMREGSAVGFIDVTGEGESIAEITFPITFTERPVFTAGLELAGNVSLQYGSFPNWSASVCAWKQNSRQYDPLYTGATLAIVVSGASASVLHYRFSGRSFTNPTNTDTSAGATL